MLDIPSKVMLTDSITQFQLQQRLSMRESCSFFFLTKATSNLFKEDFAPVHSLSLRKKQKTKLKVNKPCRIAPGSSFEGVSQLPCIEREQKEETSHSVGLLA